MLQFWQNVKEELDYNLITQKDLAAAVGISYNTLQSWITKDRLPDAEQALKIAKKVIKIFCKEKRETYSAFKKSRKLYNNYYATKTLHQFGKYFLHFVAVGLAHLAFEKLQDAKRGLVCVPYERIWRGKPFL